MPFLVNRSGAIGRDLRVCGASEEDGAASIQIALRRLLNLSNTATSKIAYHQILPLKHGHR